jgi:hypothetical protein
LKSTLLFRKTDSASWIVVLASWKSMTVNLNTLQLLAHWQGH